MKLTNHYTNSTAAMLNIVRAQENKHWFLGLRQCELELETLNRALRRWTLRRILSRLRLRREYHKEELLLQKEVLEQEKSRIIKEHPEVVNLSYRELQERYAKACFQAVQAHYIAKLHIAAQYPILGEGGAEMLLGLDSNERDEVMAIAMKRMGQACSDIALRDAANVLAELTEEQRKQSLILAGQQVVNSQAVQNLSGSSVTFVGVDDHNVFV